jgi:hypothetical protein
MGMPLKSSIFKVSRREIPDLSATVSDEKLRVHLCSQSRFSFFTLSSDEDSESSQNDYEELSLVSRDFLQSNFLKTRSQ